MQQPRSRVFPSLIIGLIGAVLGSFAMMVYASTHFATVAGPGNTPPALSAAPIAGGSDQDRIIAAVKRVAPSVVALSVVVNERQFIPADPFGLFGDQGRVRTFRRPASGSGFVYSKDGLIITNARVVPKGVTKIEVLFENGDRIPAKVYGRNVGADVALVKVDNYAKLPPPVEFANSSKLQAGQWAIAIGEPLELKQSVSLGVVSGFNRDEDIGAGNGGVQQFKGLLQTSAPINPGNSGGPLVDIEGRLIGVNQSTANPQAAQGIGFAIPSNTVREQVALIEKAPGRQIETGLGYIGAVLTAMTPEARVQFNYKGNGVGITQVQTGSPADEAGLQPGDVIEKVNGKDVTKADEVTTLIKATKPGATVAFNVWSGGSKRLVTVKVTERPAIIGGQPEPATPDQK